MNSSAQLCIICNSDRLIEINSIKSVDLLKCSHCRMVFSAAIPTPEELNSFYQKYPEYGKISPVTFLRYNEILDFLEKYRSTNNLADVGCGNGFFLDEAKKRGWNVFGTEFNDNSIRICEEKGIATSKGRFTSQSFPGKIFDVVTSFEVIEHTLTPKEEVTEIYQSLRHRGIIYLTTPNFNSLSRRLLNDKWNVLVYPEHLSYFTKRSLSYLFNTTGFKLISFKTTGISFARIFDGIKVKLLNKKPSFVNTKPNVDQDIRSTIESNYSLRKMKSAINFFLSLTGSGETIKAYFEKAE